MQVGVDALMHKAPIGIAWSLFVLVENNLISMLLYLAIYVIFPPEPGSMTGIRKCRICPFLSLGGCSHC